MKKVYEVPTFTEWGTVSELTQGTGESNYTDAEACSTPAGVTFYGSSNATFCG